VSYVDAGYAIALGVLFVYAIGLGLRRRRWERALRVAQASPPPDAPTADGADGADGTMAPVVPGGRP
jgi:hypothetical protein